MFRTPSRRLWALGLGLAFYWSAAVSAQETAPRDAAPPPAPPTAPGILDDRIDVLLREWSERTSKIHSMFAEFTRTTIDNTWRTKETFEGQARYLQPNKARLDIIEEESFVLTGQGEIWHYRIPLKQIKIYKLPPEQTGKNSLEDGPLPFLFGTKPDKAKMRYSFKILEENDKVVHVEILPKLQEDKQNFIRAEIWLNKQTFLPDKLKFIESNENEMLFAFKGIWTNLEINPEDFVPKRLPKWEISVHQMAESEEPQAPRLRR